MKYPMNVSLVATAIQYWSGWFTPTTVPALVDQDVMKHTCPPGVIDMRLYGEGDDTVVASAEQSFLQLEKEGNLPPGFWMALTPCYRDESVFDQTHLPVFLKLELMILAKEREKCHRLEAEWVAYRMQRFFREFCALPTTVIETDDGWDVMYEDLELGSFGVRETMTGRSYIYGTGLAEPRASIALLRYKQKCQSTFD